ncbi:MAG: sigma-70 family RNA polymerase sigma factor [Bacteroidetes bacterium]|nr:sigma-70 family RNA polymerase sigma factor [Bacteroidota bacterium]
MRMTIKSQQYDDDKDLILKAKTGDEQAFTQLIRKYEQLIFSFAYKVCRDREKAEETLQDTFVNVYRKIRQFDGKSKFSTWLYSIVLNNCKMKHRKTKLEQASRSIEREPSSTDTHSSETKPFDIQSPHETPLESMLNEELQERLDNAILKLPLDYRIVFVLRDIEGLSNEQTAKLMRLTVPAVKSRLRRARLFLREQLHDIVAI